eukprot:350078-Chlamydomonas_euryale.AAC.2
MPRRCGDAAGLARLAHMLASRGGLQQSGRWQAPSEREAASDKRAPASLQAMSASIGVSV